MTANRIHRIAVYAALAVLSLLFSLPFLYMIGMSFKTYDDIVASPLNPIPIHPTLDNFILLFEKIPFWTQFFNGVFIAVAVSVLSMVGNALVAYGFSRYDFKGKNVLFTIVIATILIPSQMTLVPSFIMFKQWGWLDTFSPLILPGAISAINIFLIRQVMSAIPKELYESARVDGSTEWGTFLRIAVPLSMSGIGIVGLLNFMNSWNDYLSPLIFLTSEHKMTLSVGISTMNNPYKEDYATPITGAFLMAVPVLILLSIVGRKYFISGVAAGAVKG
ncbi:carbohydrate ABC transporter permease [Paenibacillus aceris]|uniref:ABC-type glycerol-3-phosphate transport system permease component n=1 Tax=Paenibacillus aceris TaxID=869555 RepID=A0ABS4HZU6_9BACL|nr:carbohydrate ABC transporter permease [Paenibacillus aceris]MBP1964207.1 ABC-type glycerol-3-phosphate transport system permease component [Paenibacillus aceris]NHW36533.1 carbohydrate ABC transporter permease [Paenibacillus aceris]